MPGFEADSTDRVARDFELSKLERVRSTFEQSYPKCIERDGMFKMPVAWPRH